MKKIGFIGVGRMAGAIVSGMLKVEKFPPENIGLFNRTPSKLDIFSSQGCRIYNTAQALVNACDIIFISVKPQNFTEVLPLVKEAYSHEKLIVSIAAGITAEQIEKTIDKPCKIILAMPNTPLLLAQGATAIAKNERVSVEEFSEVKSIFQSVGIVEEMAIEHLTATIAVSGSTPAFIYKFAQIIADFAEEQGIEKDKAINLFSQTLIGSAKMLSETGNTPDELIQMVCSPGGTTIEGMKALEEHGFGLAITEACKACLERANELSAESN